MPDLVLNLYQHVHAVIEAMTTAPLSTPVIGIALAAVKRQRNGSPGAVTRRGRTTPTDAGSPVSEFDGEVV
jgi:hypothetical protein